MAYEYNVGGSGSAYGGHGTLDERATARQERAEREARGWMGRTHLSGLDVGRVKQILKTHGPAMTAGTRGALEQLVKDNVGPVELAREERQAAARRASTG
ncbi:hypothetical protein [Parafrankia discariae]|uniref:hypothetical protein n=1 Tax=Parafrankia discariae TaxID=365528 RepID=UPI0003825D9E|nr:hypothetical protein [Parafrankia discariae]